MIRPHLIVLVAASSIVMASSAAAGEVCEQFGPQTPRDIDQVEGTNKQVFSFAPEYQEMNLCNVHFHANAEHKAKDFSIFAGEGDNGLGGGYQCSATPTLTAAELKMPEDNVCKGVKPGDTIEVHWVHTSCAVEPGAGLGSCLSDKCATPNLRVEAQVFLVVNDPNALDFDELDYDGTTVDGYHQAQAIPNDTGVPVRFLGSTTGPSYTEQKCSPLQVSWSVRPHCAKIDVNSLNAWCADNEFEESGAQGVRALVKDPRLLSEIE